MEPVIYKLDPLLERSPKHVIFSKEVKDYRAYTSIEYDTEKLNTLLNEDKSYYEVLPENLPRKFYVDIDIKPIHKNYMKYTYQEIVDDTTKVLSASCKLINPDIKFNIDDIYVCISENSAIKQSLHITYPLYLKNQKDIKYLSSIIKHLIYTNPTDYPALIFDNELYWDPVVYSKNQNMRCLFQSKLNKKNKLIPFNRTDCTPVDYFIGIYEKTDQYEYINSKRVEWVATEMLLSQFKIGAIPADKVKDIACMYYKEFSMMPYYDLFDSTPNYNAKSTIEFYLSCIPNTIEKPQSYEMWYSLGQALRNVVVDYPDVDLLQLWIQWSMQLSAKYPNEDKKCRQAWTKFIVKETGNRYRTLFIKRMATIFNTDAVNAYHTLYLSGDMYCLQLTGFQKIDIYNKDPQNLDTVNGYCKPFDLENIKICIDSSPMGSGKTYQLFEYIKESNHPRILLVSPRKTFSKEKVAELQVFRSDFIDYTDDKVRESSYWLDFDNLALQVESLHKIEDVEDDAYHLLVLDEIESILYQFSSTTNTIYSMHNFNTFLNAIRHADKIIAADAFISNCTLSFFRLLGISANVSINKYRKKDRTAVMLGNAKNCHQLITVKNNFVSHLIDSLKKNKKIGVIIGSQKFKEVIVNTLLHEFGQEFKDKIKEYDGRVDDQNMEDLTNVNGIWGNDKIRLVIYTTKITIGVSYTNLDFDLVYIYGTSISSVPRDIIQAHFRIRHIKENKIYVSMFSGTPREIHPSIQEEGKKNKYLDEKFSRDPMCWSNKKNEEIYQNMRDFNSMEDYISTWNYEKVFNYYLDDIGYKIEYEDEKNMKDVALVNVITDIDLYHEYKIKSKDEIDKIDKKIKACKATRVEKIIVEAYYFYKHIIMNTNFLRIKHSFEEYCPDISKEDFEKQTFNTYFSDRMFKENLTNMVFERRNFTTSQMEYSKKEVINGQKDAMKIMFMKKIVSLLDIPVSFIKGICVTSDNILRVLKYYRSLKNQELDIFNEVFAMPALNCKTDIFNAKKLVNTCLYNWNGMKIKTKETIRDQRNNKYIQTYIYEIECKNILDIWRDMIDYEVDLE